MTSNECPTCRMKQHTDSLIIFKEGVENEMRTKYRDAIRTLEAENRRLNEALRRRRIPD